MATLSAEPPFVKVERGAKLVTCFSSPDRRRGSPAFFLLRTTNFALLFSEKRQRRGACDFNIDVSAGQIRRAVKDDDVVASCPANQLHRIGPGRVCLLSHPPRRAFHKYLHRPADVAGMMSQAYLRLDG